MILDVCSEVPSSVTGRIAERWAAYHDSTDPPAARDVEKPFFAGGSENREDQAHWSTLCAMSTGSNFDDRLKGLP